MPMIMLIKAIMAINRSPEFKCDSHLKLGELSVRTIRRTSWPLSQIVTIIITYKTPNL